ncbi:MAG TPA: MMPL family transporter [Gemmatimonadales bacterium]|nr:MMPL family transporter [Gemmatimonadales bacterium]
MIKLPSRFLVRFRWGVIAAWGALALLFVPRASRVQRVLALRGGPERETESKRANDLIDLQFPSPLGDYFAIVVRGPVRVTQHRFREVLDTLDAAAAREPYIHRVVSLRTLTGAAGAVAESAFVSGDKRTTFILAALAKDTTGDLTHDVVPSIRAAVRDALARVPGGTGFDVKVTGTPALDHDVRAISGEDTEEGERRVLPLTLAVLVLAFGALVAALLPIAVGVLAITIALGLVTVAAQFQPMSVFVLNIATMVGLGVGIDYSLLVVTRFREELNRGLSPTDAAVRTIDTAGEAVITSGMTVVLGFAALLTTPLVETRSVGMGGLFVVTVAVLLAVTFLPAMLAILGRNIDRPRWLARPLARIHAPTGWERWARWLAHRPWRAIAIGGSIIAVLTLPLSQIRIGVPARNWFPPRSESGQGLALLREMGANGLILPTRLVVVLSPGQSALRSPALLGLKALGDSLRRDPRVKDVRGVASIKARMSGFQLAMFYSDPDGVRARYPDFFTAYLSTDSRTTLVDVIPADSVSLTGMMGLVNRARTVIAHGIRGLEGSQILVGGFAASSVDLQADLLDRFPTVVLLILGTTAIMLFIAFRSLLVPLKAVLLNCLSVGAAFGVTVLVFQHGYGGSVFGLEGPTEAIFVVVPVLVFATVFGLSMDYEVFLLTRIKEVFDKTGRNDFATMEGLSATASTISFAAAIMIAVFVVFAFARVLAVQLIGFALALAVLFDATIIRMVLVPAIMHIAGRFNWWPGVKLRPPADDD